MSKVIVTRDGGLFVIRLMAPERRNALSVEIVDAVIEAVDEAGADESVGAIVFEAEGPAFCAGADISLLRELWMDPAEATAFSRLGRIYQMFARISQAQVPSLAAVGGTVVGAGLNLPLACDLRIVADDVRLIGFTKASLHPGGGHLAYLLRKVSSSAASAIALFDVELDAAQALASGFAWEVVTRSALEARARELARPAAADPELTRAVTATLRAASGNPEHAAILLERAPQLWSLRRLGGLSSS
jgi:enoyl-CoA hydratase